MLPSAKNVNVLWYWSTLGKMCVNVIVFGTHFTAFVSSWPGFSREMVNAPLSVFVAALGPLSLEQSSKTDLCDWKTFDM